MMLIVSHDFLEMMFAQIILYLNFVLAIRTKSFPDCINKVNTPVMIIGL